jgi:hypothetical protein
VCSARHLPSFADTTKEQTLRARMGRHPSRRRTGDSRQPIQLAVVPACQFTINALPKYFTEPAPFPALSPSPRVGVPMYKTPPSNRTLCARLKIPPAVPYPNTGITNPSKKRRIFIFAANHDPDAIRSPETASHSFVFKLVSPVRFIASIHPTP